MWFRASNSWYHETYHYYKNKDKNHWPRISGRPSLEDRQTGSIKYTQGQGCIYGRWFEVEDVRDRHVGGVIKKGVAQREFWHRLMSADQGLTCSNVEDAGSAAVPGPPAFSGLSLQWSSLGHCLHYHYHLLCVFLFHIIIFIIIIAVTIYSSSLSPSASPSSSSSLSSSVWLLWYYLSLGWWLCSS